MKILDLKRYSSILTDNEKELLEKLYKLNIPLIDIEENQPEKRPAIPFRCPMCMKECWKVIETEISELDAIEIKPYSINPISSIWKFGCGHIIERVEK